MNVFCWAVVLLSRIVARCASIWCFCSIPWCLVTVPCHTDDSFSMWKKRIDQPFAIGNHLSCSLTSKSPRPCASSSLFIPPSSPELCSTSASLLGGEAAMLYIWIAADGCEPLAKLMVYHVTLERVGRSLWRLDSMQVCVTIQCQPGGEWEIRMKSQTRRHLVCSTTQASPLQSRCVEVLKGQDWSLHRFE